MFNRLVKGQLETFNVQENLHRFNCDEYATKYLVGCYNPEFKIRICRPKEIPILGKRSIEVSRRNAKKGEDVF